MTNNDQHDDLTEIAKFTWDVVSVRRTIYLDLGDEITGSVLDYSSLFSNLSRCTQDDLIYLTLSNYGGDCLIGQRLAVALKDCHAHIHCKVTNNASSMAAILALCCKSLELTPGSRLMFHNYSGGGFGKGQELAHHVHQSDKSLQRMIQVYCAPFLTRAELKAIARDQDVYIQDDDPTLDKRCVRHFAAMKFAG